jgi:aminocarboxymuconate-semialdehyde decarboxylase
MRAIASRSGHQQVIIDSHAHLVPPSLLAAVRSEAARFPSVKPIEEHGSLAFSFAGAKPTRPVSKPLSDIAGRVAWMVENGIDKQVVGGWVDMFGYELPAAEGTAWAQLINSHLAAAAKAEPRFVPLASVPMQDGARAAAVLKAAVAAGFPGAMISTLPRGIGSVLDAADLDPFWAAADETGAVIHIHPSYDAGDSRVNDYGLANGVGRISDAIVAMARLLCSGHVTRYRNARFFAPMGAAGLPFLLGRLTRNAAITPGIADPAASLGLLYTDTILHDPRVLRFVVEMVGVERVMMGSDTPFPIGDEQPMKIVAAAGLKPDQVASITGGLARRLFRIV